MPVVNEIRNDHEVVILRVDDDSLTCPPLSSRLLQLGRTVHDSNSDPEDLVRIHPSDVLLHPYALVCLVRALEEEQIVRSANNLLRRIASLSRAWNGVIDELFYELDILRNRVILQRFEHYNRDLYWSDTIYISSFFGSPRISSTRTLSQPALSFLHEHPPCDSEWMRRLANGELFCSRSGELGTGFQAYKVIHELILESEWSGSGYCINWDTIVNKLVRIPRFREIGLELEKARNALSFAN